LLSQQIVEQSSVDTNDQVAFVRNSFELLLARQPTDVELTECQATLTQLAAVLKDAAEGRGRTVLVHALLNHNDFVTIR
jgi:hypothetical protein